MSHAIKEFWPAERRSKGGAVPRNAPVHLAVTEDATSFSIDRNYLSRHATVPHEFSASGDRPTCADRTEKEIERAAEGFDNLRHRSLIVSEAVTAICILVGPIGIG